MKIRNGFVSNSSSSSFVIILPHKPADMEDARSLILKPLDRPSLRIEDRYSDDSLSLDTAASVLLNAINTSELRFAEAKAFDKVYELTQLLYEMHYRSKERDPVLGRYISSSEYDKLLSLATKMNKADKAQNHAWNSEMGRRNNKAGEWAVARDEVHASPAYKAAADATETATNIYEAYCKKLAEQLHYTWNERGWYGIISFGDDSRQGALMEHGDAFEHVEHFKINQH